VNRGESPQQLRCGSTYSTSLRHDTISHDTALRKETRWQAPADAALSMINAAPVSATRKLCKVPRNSMQGVANALQGAAELAASCRGSLSGCGGSYDKCRGRLSGCLGSRCKCLGSSSSCHRSCGKCLGSLSECRGGCGKCRGSSSECHGSGCKARGMTFGSRGSGCKVVRKSVQRDGESSRE
jgi:hypothetical protein